MSRSVLSRAFLVLVLGSALGCNCNPRVAQIRPVLHVYVDGQPESDPPLKSGDTVAFGTAKVGDGLVKVFVLRNEGSAPLRFKTMPSLKSGDQGFLLDLVLASGDLCGPRPEPTIIDSGSCAVVRVLYKPARIGGNEDYLLVDSEDVEAPHFEVHLVADANSPRIAFCAVGGVDGISSDVCASPGAPPPVIRFPTTSIGQASTVRIASLSNGGGLPLQVFVVALQKSDQYREFSVDRGFSGPVAPGAAPENFQVSFLPSAGGPRVAYIAAITDDPNQSPALIRLEGTGDAPKLCPDPLPDLNFGDVIQGKTKDMTATLTNCGTKALTVNSVTYSGSASFTLTGTVPSNVLLQPGSAATVTVHYAPPVIGPDTGKLSIVSTDPSTPTGFIDVKGNGVDTPRCRLEPSSPSLDFGSVGVGITAKRALTLRNAGTLACTLSALGPDPAAPGTGTAAFRLDTMPLAPATIAPNGLVDITIAYIPADATGPDTGAFAFSSDDPSSPLIVPVTGSPTATPQCQLTVVPAYTTIFGFGGRNLHFGMVKVGVEKELPVTLTNTGSADCTVRSGDLSLLTDKSVFSKKGASIPLPAVLAPGQSEVITVGFKPTSINGWNPVTNVLLIQTSDPSGSECTVSIPSDGTPGCKLINLDGNGAKVSIEGVPSSLDFGLVTLGCNSQDKTVTIYNTGQTTVDVNKIWIDPLAAPFRVIQAPALPLTMAPGASANVVIRFRPPDTNIHNALLTVDNSTGASLTVPLKGQGTTSSHQVDTFQQLATPKTDILLLADNSCSMHDKQGLLAQNAQTFTNLALSSGNDFHLGVVTTEWQNTSPYKAGAYSAYQGTGNIEAGVLFPALAPNPKWLERTTPNVAGLFANYIRVGECCSDAAESGLEGAHMALTPPNITDPAKNGGFLRPDAKLALIMLSDEDDQGPATTLFYANMFWSLKGPPGNDRVTVHAIVGDPGGCSANVSFGGGVILPISASGGPRYIDVANKTGGLFRSICSGDWGRIAQDIGLDAFAAQASFYLSRLANPSTLAVTVDGVSKAQGPDYTYDSTKNAVIFVAGRSPTPGQTIVIAYDALCL